MSGMKGMGFKDLFQVTISGPIYNGHPGVKVVGFSEGEVYGSVNSWVKKSWRLVEVQLVTLFCYSDCNNIQLMAK